MWYHDDGYYTVETPNNTFTTYSEDYDVVMCVTAYSDVDAQNKRQWLDNGGDPYEDGYEIIIA